MLCCAVLCCLLTQEQDEVCTLWGTADIRDCFRHYLHYLLLCKLDGPDKANFKVIVSEVVTLPGHTTHATPCHIQQHRLCSVCWCAGLPSPDKRRRAGHHGVPFVKWSGVGVCIYAGSGCCVQGLPGRVCDIFALNVMAGCDHRMWAQDIADRLLLTGVSP